MWQIYTSLPDLWIDEADAGEILLNGIPLKENSPLIGYMLQHDHLLDWRSIYRNVTLGPEICGTLNTATKNVRMSFSNNTV